MGRIYNPSGEEIGELGDSGNIIDSSGSQRYRINSDGRIYDSADNYLGYVSDSGRVYRANDDPWGEMSDAGIFRNLAGDKILEIPGWVNPAKRKQVSSEQSSSSSASKPKPYVPPTRHDSEEPPRKRDGTTPPKEGGGGIGEAIGITLSVVLFVFLCTVINRISTFFSISLTVIRSNLGMILLITALIAGAIIVSIALVNGKGKAILITMLIFVVGFALGFGILNIEAGKAVKYLENEDYEKAAEILCPLRFLPKAESLIQKYDLDTQTRYAPYSKGNSYLREGKYYSAAMIFQSLGTYKNSEGLLKTSLKKLVSGKKFRYDELGNQKGYLIIDFDNDKVTTHNGMALLGKENFKYIDSDFSSFPDSIHMDFYWGDSSDWHKDGKDRYRVHLELYDFEDAGFEGLLSNGMYGEFVTNPYERIDKTDSKYDLVIGGNRTISFRTDHADADEAAPTATPSPVADLGAEVEPSAETNIDIYDGKRLPGIRRQVSNATASSTLEEEGFDNRAYRILDGDIHTAWQEGAEGNGVGESFSVNLGDEIVNLTGVAIYTGYLKDEAAFYKNGAPSSISMITEYGDRVTMDLYEYADSYERASSGFAFSFKEPFNLSGELTFRIDDVRPGSEYNDTCVSEIILYATNHPARYKLQPVNVTASSTLLEEGFDNGVHRVIDGDIQTGWQEGAVGNGIGESFSLDLGEETVYFSSVVIYTGDLRSSDWFYRNGAPSSITMITNIGSQVRMDLHEYADSYERASSGYTCFFDKPFYASGQYTFRIDDVRPGSEYEDAVVSEIVLYAVN